MQIQINKDLEEAYKDELIKGFSLREAIYITISIAIIGGVAALMYFKFGIMLDIGIYIAIPFGLPTLFIGIKKFQGLTPVAYARELYYVWRTRVLVYDADELPDRNRIFTMQSREKRKGNSRWTG